MNDTIEKICALEWEMFQNVSNVGGRAPCQDDMKSFVIMRTSQAMSWSEGTLESYHIDLLEAKETGRNLMTEKYARMMASTSPAEFDEIKDALPSLSPEAVAVMEEIIRIYVGWEEEVAAKYPNTVRRGRPLRSEDDTQNVTSLETYLRGELSTYSLRTLVLYLDNMLRQKDQGINAAELVLQSTLKQYGFNSIQEAEDRLKAGKKE